MKFVGTQKAYEDLALLDILLGYKMKAEEFTNNEKVVKLLCETVDKLRAKTHGYCLISITNGNKSVLQIIDKNSDDYRKYRVLTWEIKEKIEKGMMVKCHEEGSDSITLWMANKSKEILGRDATDEVTEHLVMQSLNGYCTSRKKFELFCKFLEEDGIEGILAYDTVEKRKAYRDAHALKNYFMEEVSKERRRISNTISNFIDKSKLENLRKSIGFKSFRLTNARDGRFHIGKITKVIQSSDKRYFKVELAEDNPSASTYATTNIVSKASAGVGAKINFSKLGEAYIAEVRPHYGNDFDPDKLRDLPYNWVDEGRLIMAIPRQHCWNLIVGPDPKVSENPVAAMETALSDYVKNEVKRGVDLSGTQIRDGEKTLSAIEFEKSLDSDSSINPIQRKLQAIKKMIDEYKYIVKKEESKGQDVAVTDKVRFNHDEGKVSYNEFSLAVDDELIKQEIFQCFERYLVQFYRGSMTEEQILNDVIDSIFNAVDKRINSYSKEPFIINLQINENIHVQIEAKISKNKSKMIYLNGQRFNRNEVITVLKEMTCYRDQATADMFIKNIGKMGLSVYIGCTSGYLIAEKMYRFKKLKGRSNYALLLDTIEIPIKGKTLLNHFYADFNGEPVYDFNGKIPKIIYKSVQNSLDYVKYKFLIDSAYEAFKDRSKEFLEKKIADVKGEKCRYWNKKRRKEMESVKLTGMSGNSYVIAYDEKNSFVFINPEIRSTEGELPIYEEGKYVCMIDQSNIKSNIGYDTVISKMMALSCDSVIASKIYNLEEELNG